MRILSHECSYLKCLSLKRLKINRYQIFKIIILNIKNLNDHFNDIKKLYNYKWVAK